MVPFRLGSFYFSSSVLAELAIKVLLNGWGKQVRGTERGMRRRGASACAQAHTRTHTHKSAHPPQVGSTQEVIWADGGMGSASCRWRSYPHATSARLCADPAEMSQRTLGTWAMTPGSLKRASAKKPDLHLPLPIGMNEPEPNIRT